MTVLLPSSTREALEYLAEVPHAIPIAGATDLFVHWPTQVAAHDRTYLDLSALRELRAYEWTDDALVLGGLTTYWDVMQDDRAGREFPLLFEAARQVGAVQIQARRGAVVRRRFSALELRVASPVVAAAGEYALLE